MPAADDSLTKIVRDLMRGRNVDGNFEKLFRRYCPAVSAYFARSGFSGEECRDLTQEVFLAVYRNVGDLREEGAFAGWLFSIARHIRLRYLSEKKKLPQAAWQWEDQDGEESNDLERQAAPAGEPEPLRRMLDQEKVQAVMEALKEQPVRVQECLRARLVDGLKHSEIGEKLGISENTVAVHVHRGMKSLRASLKHLIGGAPFIGGIDRGI